MKKIISIVILAVMLLSVSGIAVFAAAAQTPSVTITVSDGKEIVVANEKVAVEEGKTDTLGGLFKVINEKYGKKYETAQTEYGESITCFWGIENGGSYGYYVNDQMAMGLADKVKAGDRVYAFVFSDTTGWSDTYSYFDLKEVTVKKGEAVTLTLSHLGFDESWNTVVLPVEKANVTLDGVAVNAQTDAAGKITFTPAKSGLVTATSDTLTLVPPICVVTVEAPFPTAGVIIAVCIAVVVVAAVVIVIVKKKK